MTALFPGGKNFILGLNLPRQGRICPMMNWESRYMGSGRDGMRRLSQCGINITRLYQYSIIDDLVKSRNSIELVIPAKAGIQSF